MKMELEETRNQNKKMEKLWKAQIKEEEDAHYSPRNMPGHSLVSCVDPTVTKSKINQILKSIRSF